MVTPSNILLRFDTCAYFHIHVAVEFHEQMRVVGDNSGVINQVVTKLSWVLTTEFVLVDNCQR